MLHRTFLVLALIAFVCGGVQAQKKTTSPEAAQLPVEKTAAELEAERVLRERRANAQSLLVNLASDARYFSDASLRARILTRTADMLWDSDHERSKSLFHSAWDAAEVADTEGQARMQEEIRKQQAANPRGGYSVTPPPNLRQEVLSAAVKRDRKLGEEFLAKLEEFFAKLKDEKPEDRSRRLESGDGPTEQRFRVAQELLSAGDAPRALEFAEPALSSVTVNSVNFLATLREKDAAFADQRYAVMLQNAAQNRGSDANTVALLAAYIFSPHTYVTFMPSGGLSAQGSSRGAVNVSAELRAAFFRSAGAILTRLMSQQLTGRVDGQYLAIKRMLPLFEQFGPAELTATIKVQLDSLTALASEMARNRDDQFMHQGIDSNWPPKDRPADKQPFDREQTLFDQVDRATNSAERDQANQQLALLMVDQDYRRARDYVDKIDEMEMRNATRAYVDMAIAYKLNEKRDTDRLLEFMKNADLTHFQRSWLLSQAAAQIGVRDHEKALPVLDDAVAEARRIESGDPDRPRALFAIANVTMRINRKAVWDTMGDAITAANSAEGFSGEDAYIAFHLSGKGTNTGHRHLIRDMDVADIFTLLGGEDYDKAVTLARGFQSGAPRAHAVIAIAKSVLDEKKK